MRAVVWAGVVCIVVILVVGGWNVLASQVLHGDVTPRSLYLSVQNQSGGGDPFMHDRRSVCRRVPGASSDAWTCEIEDPGGSGNDSAYRVKVRGSCWDATGGSSSLPRKVSGCVHLRED